MQHKTATAASHNSTSCPHSQWKTTGITNGWNMTPLYANSPSRGVVHVVSAAAADGELPAPAAAAAAVPAGNTPVRPVGLKPWMPQSMSFMDCCGLSVGRPRPGVRTSGMTYIACMACKCRCGCWSYILCCWVEEGGVWRCAAVRRLPRGATTCVKGCDTRCVTKEKVVSYTSKLQQHESKSSQHFCCITE